MLGSIIELFEEQDINYDISLFNPKNDNEKINESVSAYFPFMKTKNEKFSQDELSKKNNYQKKSNILKLINTNINLNVFNKIIPQKNNI